MKDKKNIIKERYSEIAKANSGCDCESSCCDNKEISKKQYNGIVLESLIIEARK